MAPKKSIAKQLRARFSLVRRDPEEGGDDEPGEFDPSLNREGAKEIDKLIGPQSRNEKHYA